MVTPQYKIGLSDDLKEALSRSAKANNRPLSQEIRERLERSFDYNEKDLKLCEAVKTVFENLARPQY